MAFQVKIGSFEMNFGQKKPETRGAALTGSDILAILGDYAKTGVSPTDKNLFSIPPAFAAIAYISKGVASLPFDVFRRTENGSEPATGHPLYRLFTGRPHPLYTKFNFFQALVANALQGDGFARIHYGEDMRPVNLELIPREYVLPVFAQDGNLWYQVSGMLNGQSVTTMLRDWEVLHIKGVSVNGINGLPVRLIHSDNLGTALSAQKVARQLFENGAHVPGFLKVAGSLKPGQADIIRGEFKRKFVGAENAGEIPVFDMGIDYVQTGLKPQESNLLDFRKLTAQDCSRIFQIPLHLLAELERSTFTNMEQQSADFLTHTIMPWVTQIEDEFDSKLFSANEVRARRYFTKFNMSAFMRADLKSKGEYFSKGIAAGFLTPNDVRDMEGLNRKEGGDDLLVQINMQKMKDMQAPDPATPGQANPDPATPEPTPSSAQ